MVLGIMHPYNTDTSNFEWKYKIHGRCLLFYDEMEISASTYNLYRFCFYISVESLKCDGWVLHALHLLKHFMWVLFADDSGIRNRFSLIGYDV